MKRIALKKPLGQHHLTDASLCRRPIEALRPNGRRVFEIGPGGGVLTRALLDEGAEVWAWEIDREWAFELRSRISDRELRVVVGDALDLPWERLPAGALIAGNLPFNIATPLIERMLLRGRGVERAAVLVQKEVADRLVARPSDPDYGSLSVLVAARARTRRLGTVPRSRFRPPPRVDGAFVGFELVEPVVPTEELPAFARTVRAAFGMRRKTLRNSLAAAWGRESADRALAALELDTRVRAEVMALEEFVRLHVWARDPPSSGL